MTDNAYASAEAFEGFPLKPQLDTDGGDPDHAGAMPGGAPTAGFERPVHPLRYIGTQRTNRGTARLRLYLPFTPGYEPWMTTISSWA